jgi:broad specificity phosphatase PhoE
VSAIEAAALVFIRHGETDWNVEHRLQGQQDVPLNEVGREQARRNGRALRQIAGIEAYDFVASPLDRAVETMRILRTELGLPPDDFRVDPGLIEITFGAWEGFTLAELSVEQADNVHQRQADKWHYVPPSGESYAMLSERVARWLAGVGTDTVAVSHGAVGRAIQGLLSDIPEMDVPSLPSPQDRVFVNRRGETRWI